MLTLLQKEQNLNYLMPVHRVKYSSVFI